VRSAATPARPLWIQVIRAAYVGGIPLALLVLTGIWWRRRDPRRGS
jgi:hypothetical protein